MGALTREIKEMVAGRAERDPEFRREMLKSGVEPVVSQNSVATFPQRSYGFDRVLAHNAGTFFTCALTSSDSVFCWGANHSGQLGVGDEIDRNEPTPVEGIGSGINEIAVGANHACALSISGGISSQALGIVDEVWRPSSGTLRPWLAEDVWFRDLENEGTGWRRTPEFMDFARRWLRLLGVPSANIGGALDEPVEPRLFEYERRAQHPAR